MISLDFLSIWEVANRWHRSNPNLPYPDNIYVQDTLRYLCRLALNSELTLYEEIFSTTENSRGEPKFEAWVHEIREMPSGIADCAAERIFNKKVLDSYLISREQMFELTLNTGKPFPEFWEDDDLIELFGGIPFSKIKPQKPPVITRTSVIDKTICQAVAKTLWDIYPDMNIAQMTRHPSILQYGGGSNYKGKNTLRDWLSEVAPDHIKNRPGRPSSKPKKDAG